MIRSALHHLPFFAISGLVMVLLCIDVGQGKLACTQQTPPVAEKPGGAPIKVVPNKKKAEQKKADDAAKKALEEARKKLEKEREQAQLRIKKLEQRMARMREEANQLMQKIASELKTESAARKAAEQKLAETNTKNEKLIQKVEKQQAEHEQQIEAKVAARQAELAGRQAELARQLAAQIEAVREEERAKRDAERAKREKLEKQMTAEAAERAALAGRLDEERKRNQASQKQLAFHLNKETDRRKALERKLDAQQQASAKRQRELEQQLAIERRRSDDAAARRDKDVTDLQKKVADQQTALDNEQARRRRLEREMAAEAARARARVANEAARRAAERRAFERRLAELARQPKRTAPKKPAGGPQKKVTSWKGYLDFLAPVNSIQLDKDGADLPLLDIDHRIFADNLVSIMRFYQMGFYGLVIYPKRNEKDPSYLKIDVSNGVSRARFSLSSNAREIDRLASIGRIWNGLPIGKALLARIQAERAIKVPSGAYLALLNLFPRSTAQYFIWKRIEVCKRNGIQPSKVNRCLATFRRTTFGSWIVVIDRVELKDGRTLKVRDFELSRVKLSDNG